jgi:hypothetical protein
MAHSGRANATEARIPVTLRIKILESFSLPLG